MGGREKGGRKEQARARARERERERERERRSGRVRSATQTRRAVCVRHRSHSVPHLRLVERIAPLAGSWISTKHAHRLAPRRPSLKLLRHYHQRKRIHHAAREEAARLPQRRQMVVRVTRNRRRGAAALPFARRGAARCCCCCRFPSTCRPRRRHERCAPRQVYHIARSYASC